jgi:DNA primase catalytic core
MGERFSDAFLDELRAKLPVSEVVGKTVKLKKKGHEFVGLSPFAAEKTPSFTVSDQKSFYHDFSSGKHGDIFSFLVETEGCTFPEAVERCAALAGLPLPARVNGASTEHQAKRVAMIEIVELAAAFYQQQLMESAGAAGRDYLAARGITAAAIERFRIGFAPDARFALKEHLGARGIPVEDMIAAGLLIHGDEIPVPYDRFRDRVMFPITDLKGRVIAFGGRAISGATNPKYLNSPDSDLFHKGQVLYNAGSARPAVQKGSQLIVVEGYLDVVSMVMTTFEGAVAPLGTALTAEQLAMLWRLSPEPCLCFDGDGAGRRAAYRAIDLALPAISAEKRVTFVLLPDGRDPDELARALGPTGMAKIMSAKVPLQELLWERETAAPADTPEACAAIQKRLMDCVGQIADEATRQFYRDDYKVRLDRLFAERRGQVQAQVDVSVGGLHRGADIGEALAGERIVVVTATEAECDQMAAIGLPATTAPGGAAAWEARHTDELRGADVLVVAGPGSEAGVKALCTALSGHTARLRRIVLLKSVEDWVADGGSASMIYDMATAQREWSAEAFKPKLNVVWFHEIGRSKPKRDWLIKNLFLARTLCVIYGAPGCGKSFLTSDMTLTAAAAPYLNSEQRPPWFGYRSRQFGVVYVVAEGSDDFEIRLHAWREHYRLPVDAVIPFVFLPTGVNMRTNDADTKLLIADIGGISGEMESRCGVKVCLVVIDTVARVLAAGNENSSEVMSAFVANCDRLREQLGVAVVGIHHGGKEAGRGPRGHEALHGACDLEIEVLASEEGEPNKWIVRKFKSGPQGASHQFRLRQAIVGQDEDGDPITTCIVTTPTEGASPAEGGVIPDGYVKLPPKATMVFRALNAAIQKHGMPAPAGIPCPTEAFCVQLETWREEFNRVAKRPGDDDKKLRWRVDKAIDRAIDIWLTRGLIGKDGDFIWRTGRKVFGVDRAPRREAKQADRSDHMSAEDREFVEKGGL